MNFKTVAILPAAGSGERLGISLPKQYCDVLGRPIIVHTLDSFQRIEWIESVIVAVSSDRLDYMKQILSQYCLTKVKLIEGDISRHRSIKKCIDAIGDNHDNKPDIVIIHDAVRPFADEDIMSQVALAAHKYGASGTVQPLVSTVIAPSHEGFLDHSLVRSKYRASHTPQAFQYSVIKAAYNKLTEHDLDFGTECLHLALDYVGTRAKLIDTEGDVWKVTYKKDLYAAEGIAKEKNIRIALISSKPNLVMQDIKDELEQKNLTIVSVCSNLSDVSSAVNAIVLDLFTLPSQNSHCLVKETYKKLQNQCKNGGSLVVMAQHGNGDDVLQQYQLYHSMCKKLATEGIVHGVCINTVFITTQQDYADDRSLLCKVVTMVTDLIFHRNLVFSGQVFQLP